ncbi:hypothetical protein GHT06_019014 [Daphnia sinensis]|uniref:Retrotransposon Copia-like N-terminal domain-containing protein n=1 Tax=Daphnia sinensis TaxID=1820382 RepID=A0AAD5PN57_9CRUS|nr:hypothetical protein GHT06_019014 [Daphnia sinensis]
MANQALRDIQLMAKFDGSNYPSWKYGILMVLEKQMLLSVVDGSETKPQEVMNLLQLKILCVGMSTMMISLSCCSLGWKFKKKLKFHLAQVTTS